MAVAGSQPVNVTIVIDCFLTCRSACVPSFFPLVSAHSMFGPIEASKCSFIDLFTQKQFTLFPERKKRVLINYSNIKRAPRVWCWVKTQTGTLRLLWLTCKEKEKWWSEIWSCGRCRGKEKGRLQKSVRKWNWPSVLDPHSTIKACCLNLSLFFGRTLCSST